MQITTKLCWTRHATEKFTDRRYHRTHWWQFDGGATTYASSSPEIVRAPFSDPHAVDPEEAFLASISSCHMLFFLDFAAQEGWIVNEYLDQAVGFMIKEDGHLWMSKATLRPKIRWEGATPDSETLQALHDRAHHHCFIARSVRTAINTEI